ncbi:hypothetical protein V6N11_014764 [Hibiscus sabdariffa]|uniref:RNase H type-1 domain-containing protein n=1 Tax=Hibiscus sabdariffa TaxID=183260 RepID=A0ABR2TQ23_9ROSI
MQFFKSLSLKSWMLMCLRQPEQLAIGMDRWSVLFSIICWKLWTRRNMILFDADYVEKEDLLIASERYMAELGRGVDGQYAAGGRALSQYPLPTLWTCPDEGWFKLNVDAAVQPGVEVAAIGGVIRSSAGVWVFGFARNIGRCSVVNAELWAVHDGLIHAWRLGFRSLVLESDNMEVVKLLQSRTKCTRWSTLAVAIWRLLE